MAHFQPILHRPIPGKNWLLILAIVLLHGGALLAQPFAHIGQVVSVTPGCGAVIKQIDNGDFFHAVKYEGILVPGKIIFYNAVQVEPLPDCPQDGLPVLGLNAWTDSPLDEAHFSYTVSPDNPYKYTFKAELDGLLNVTCIWSFGDNIATGLTGDVIDYTFQQTGTQTVCLRLVNLIGVVAQSCQEILVSGEPAGPCGYNTYVTGIGKQIYAKLLPQTSNAGPLTAINWTNGSNPASLGNTASLNTEMPDYGPYSICATYTVDAGANLSCTGTLCKDLTLVEPGCANVQLMGLVQACPPQDVPVCGCDQQTYLSECDALAAGVTTWWAGDCNSIYGSCLADLDMEVTSGNPDMGYNVLFTNKSGGNSSLCHLDFGDGSPIWEATQWTEKPHFYAKGGMYRVTLSVWKQNSCASTVSKLLITDALNLTAENMPDPQDYVLPGDANRDTKANVYDLLDIGVGYLTSGAPRPNASSEFKNQFAPNWPVQLVNAEQPLNYKHFDCDGDGTVLDMDVDLIEPHYSPIDSFEVLPVPGAPEVWVEFPQSVIEVDPNNPFPLEIKANVMVGSATAPALDLYGLAFALKYPEYVEHDPEVDYKNDFFGISNHILWLPKDNYDERQLDLGFTKKYASSSGFGRIATLTFRSDFVIIIDVIDREIGDVKPFTVPVRGLRAVDKDGQPLIFGTPAIQDTLWIKMVETSGTQEKTLAQQVSVYPNPATSEVRVFTGDLEVEHLEAVNALGQVVYSAAPVTGKSQRLQVSNWPKGLYTLRLQTTQGPAEKKLMVH